MAGETHAHTHHHGRADRLRHLLTPHSHDSAVAVDSALESSSRGIRTLLVSFAVLAVTAAVQALAAAVSGSFALLGDPSALTAVPLGLAFWVGRRPPPRRYTYGFGRSEDLAGIVIVVLIAASSALAAYEALDRLLHPQDVSHLWAVAVAALVGFAGNE